MDVGLQSRATRGLPTAAAFFVFPPPTTSAWRLLAVSCAASVCLLCSSSASLHGHNGCGAGQQAFSTGRCSPSAPDSSLRQYLLHAAARQRVQRISDSVVVSSQRGLPLLDVHGRPRVEHEAASARLPPADMPQLIGAHYMIVVCVQKLESIKTNLDDDSLGVAIAVGQRHPKLFAYALEVPHDSYIGVLSSVE